MNKFQKQIKKFCKDRDWNQFFDPKDLLLGIVEEVGEMRNTVKWVQGKEALKKVIRENKEEFEDNIGDLYWFLAILASENNIDVDEAISKVIGRNKKRFPIAKTKSRHTNTKFGGFDKNNP
ncbi:MAG: MazG nucleotide pyrophosphohydrolase domain-containing protein, partial [Candidatus Spechtbacterales bacterium]